MNMMLGRVVIIVWLISFSPLLGMEKENDIPLNINNQNQINKSSMPFNIKVQSTLIRAAIHAWNHPVTPFIMQDPWLTFNTINSLPDVVNPIRYATFPIRFVAGKARDISLMIAGGAFVIAGGAVGIWLMARYWGDMATAGEFNQFSEKCNQKVKETQEHITQDIHKTFTSINGELAVVDGQVQEVKKQCADVQKQFDIVALTVQTGLAGLKEEISNQTTNINGQAIELNKVQQHYADLQTEANKQFEILLTKAGGQAQAISGQTNVIAELQARVRTIGQENNKNTEQLLSRIDHQDQAIDGYAISLNGLYDQISQFGKRMSADLAALFANIRQQDGDIKSHLTAIEQLEKNLGTFKQNFGTCFKNINTQLDGVEKTMQVENEANKQLWKQLTTEIGTALQKLAAENNKYAEIRTQCIQLDTTLDQSQQSLENISQHHTAMNSTITAIRTNDNNQRKQLEGLHACLQQQTADLDKALHDGATFLVWLKKTSSQKSLKKSNSTPGSGAITTV